MRPYHFSPPQIAAPEQGVSRGMQARKYWPSRTAAVLTAAAGTLHLASILSVTGYDAGVLDVVTGWCGLVLILLAVDLWWRRRNADRVSLAVLTFAAVCHLIQGRGIAAGSISIAVAAYLLASVPLLRGRNRVLSLEAALQRIAFACAAPVWWGMAGFVLMDHAQFGTGFSWWQAIHWTLRLVTFAPGPVPPPLTGYAAWFLGKLCCLAGTAYVYSASAVLPALRGDVDWRTDAMATSSHNEAASLFFSPSRQAYLEYKVQGQFAVVLGDPTGRTDEIPLVVRQFNDYCREQGLGVGYQHEQAADGQSETVSMRGRRDATTRQRLRQRSMA